MQEVVQWFIRSFTHRSELCYFSANQFPVLKLNLNRFVLTASCINLWHTSILVVRGCVRWISEKYRFGRFSYLQDWSLKSRMWNEIVVCVFIYAVDYSYHGDAFLICSMENISDCYLLNFETYSVLNWGKQMSLIIELSNLCQINDVWHSDSSLLNCYLIPGNEAARGISLKWLSCHTSMSNHLRRATPP